MDGSGLFYRSGTSRIPEFFTHTSQQDPLKGFWLSFRPCPDCSRKMYSDSRRFVCLECGTQLENRRTNSAFRENSNN